MFQIVASDLDGTLLSPDHKLTVFTRKILRLLTAKNIHFVFATGRHHINVTKIKKSLDIRAYMITSNGARIHNSSDQLILSYNFDKDIISDLLNIVDNDENIFTNIFRNNEWLINRYQFDQINFFREFSFNCRIYQKQTLSLDGIFKIYFTSKSYQKLLILEKVLNKRWGNRINISFSLPICLEVMPSGVSKGSALQHVASLLGYQLKDCISFGDGMNDKEMLVMAGKGCIMGNAQQRLKDALPSLEVIGSNKDEAVPYFLKKMYFKNIDLD